MKTLTAAQYVAFIERVQTIVQSHGKQMIGWDEIAPAELLPTTIVQHWRPDGAPTQAVAKGKVDHVARQPRLPRHEARHVDADRPALGRLYRRPDAYDWDPLP